MKTILLMEKATPAGFNPVLSGDDRSSFRIVKDGIAVDVMVDGDSVGELESVMRGQIPDVSLVLVVDDPGQLPMPLLLWCPECGERHIDKGELATRPHKVHACQECGHQWKPAMVPTAGVRFLPGSKDE